jgi:hypothetical protein
VFRHPLELVVTVLFAAGWLTGVAATVVSAIRRKEHLSLREWFWAGSDVAVHTERYVREESVKLVRRLTLLGLVPMVTAVLLAFGYACVRLFRALA